MSEREIGGSLYRFIKSALYPLFPTSVYDTLTSYYATICAWLYGLPEDADDNYGSEPEIYGSDYSDYNYDEEEIVQLISNDGAKTSIMLPKPPALQNISSSEVKASSEQSSVAAAVTQNSHPEQGIVLSLPSSVKRRQVIK